MANGSRARNAAGSHINHVGITSDTLTSRAGLSFFARYLGASGMLASLEHRFGGLRGSAKAQPVGEVFKQLFCFLLDGSSRHLSYFDALQKDTGYAATIESTPAAMMSSHSIKRFLQKLGRTGYQFQLRALLSELWLWRLRRERPDVVELGLDSMVLNNDEAQARQGVTPTYKKVKGFHPLQLTWRRYIVDAVFRGGRHHSNHGDSALHMLTRAVQLIRRYDAQVPIVVRTDSGFFDETLFKHCDALGIAFICGGKIYQDIKEYVRRAPDSAWQSYQHGDQQWEYLDFTDQRGTWDERWEALYLRPVAAAEQLLLEFARPETVLYTNLSYCWPHAPCWQAAGLAHWLQAPRIIESSHDRGADELVHRAFKDFGFEQLPFERFAANGAMYYSMVVAFMLFEAFKYDVCQHGEGDSAALSVVPLTAYASTVRRRLLDVAGKIVRSGGEVCLKVTAAAWAYLDWARLWQQCNTPPRLCQT